MIRINKNRCDFCGTCVAVCPIACIILRESNISIEDERCTDCNLCVDICPINVFETDKGSELNVNNS